MPTDSPPNLDPAALKLIDGGSTKTGRQRASGPLLCLLALGAILAIVTVATKLAPQSEQSLRTNGTISYHVTRPIGAWDLANGLQRGTLPGLAGRHCVGSPTHVISSWIEDHNPHHGDATDQRYPKGYAKLPRC